MTKIHTLNHHTFTPTIQREGIVLVDFWAPWCGPCRSFAPIFEGAAAEHPEITFATVDTDAESALAAAARISSMPTVMAFRDGVLVYSQPGALTPLGLQELIESVQNLDMHEVHSRHSHG